MFTTVQTPNKKHMHGNRLVYQNHKDESLDSQDDSDDVPSGTRASLRRRLNYLPPEIFTMIFKHISGVAEIENHIQYLQHIGQHPDLRRIAAMICSLKPTMLHICRAWRNLFLPHYCKYALYEGSSNCLVQPAENLDYLRYLAILIPDNSLSYRNVARGLYWLPDKVRAGVQWLGLCMGSNTGLSLSEYGALVEAFPNLRSIYVDMGSLDTRAKSIEGVILGAHKTVTLSTLRLKTKGTAGKPTFRALIKHAAHSLEYLDLGPVDTADACRVLWGDDTSGSFVSAVTGGSVSDWRPRVRFPRLRRLYFSVFGGESDSVTTPVPVCCQFPLLEELCYRVFGKKRSIYYSEARQTEQSNRTFLLETLLMHPLSKLRVLQVDNLQSAEYLVSSLQMPELVHLTLICHRQSRNINLTQMLCRALSASSLRYLACKYESYKTLGYSGLALSSLPDIHGSLRVLNLESFPINLRDLCNLIDRLPKLADVRVTLINKQSKFLNPKDFRIHMAITRLWIDAVHSKDSIWDSASLNSIIRLATNMPILKQLLLFRKAFEKLTLSIKKSRSEDLCILARTVNIGVCHRDEDSVRETTTLCL